MIHDISYYRRIHGTNGVQTQKEADLRAFRKEVERSFKETLNWEMAEVNGEEQELQIAPGGDGVTKKIKAKPGEVLRLGDIVKWQGTRWIINVLDADHQINYQGKMVQCNLLLRWQIEDGSVHQEFGWDKDGSKYCLGETHSNYLDTGDFTMKVIVQVNPQTLKVRRGQRFLLGQYGEGTNPLAVEVTRVNGVTNTYEYEDDSEQRNSGIIELTLHETQFNENTDNAELGLADYFPSNEPNAPNEAEAPEAPDESGWF